MIKNSVNKFVKKTVLLTLTTAVLVSSMGCNKTKIENNKAKVEEKVEQTPEPCVFINEWDKTLFEVFGFPNLEAPYESFYHTIEKGRTYLKAEFSTDELDEFLEFFRKVYKVMWGEVTDPLQVINKVEDTYSFEGEYVVPQVFKRALDGVSDINDRPEKTAYLKIVYIENEGKCTLECKLLDKAEENKKKNNKDQEIDNIDKENDVQQ